MSPCHFIVNDGHAVPRKRLLAALVAALLLGGSGASVAGTGAGAGSVTVADGDTVPDATTADDVEFDPSFFAAGGGMSGDVSRFAVANANAMLAGTYRMDVRFNGEALKTDDVRFVQRTGDRTALPCVDAALLITAGVLPEHIQATNDGGDTCMRISELVEGATADVDGGALIVDFTVPQAFIGKRPRGYVDPALWDAGVNAGTLGYRFNTFRSAYDGRATNSSYLGLDGGLNLGAWRLRHQGNVTTSSRQDLKYEELRTYVQRDLPGLRSQMVVGDTFTDGQIFDSIRLRGARLYTDDRMLPQSMVGYAPVIRGVATTQARVQVKQNGYVIHEISVSPGPFEINDLYATGYGGDLMVSVLEADGREDTFVVPYAATPNLLRPGYTRYSVAVGELAEAGVSETPFLAHATVEHGLNNVMTAYAGVMRSTDYAAYLGGTAVNTGIGAFSVDVTHSQARVQGGDTWRGQSVQLRYSKNFTAGTNVALGAYRYSTDGYLTLAEAQRMRQVRASGGDEFDRTRSRLQATINQRLGDKGGSLYITGSMQDYWNRPGRSTSYSAGYAHRIGPASFNLSVQRSRITIGNSLAASTRSDTRFNLNVVMPLGNQGNRPSLSASLSGNRGSAPGTRVGVSGTTGSDRQFNYSASAHRGQGQGLGYDLSGGYTAPYANFVGAYGAGHGYSSQSFGMAGGVVAHKGGVTLSQSLGETIALVEAKGARGATIGGRQGVTVDRRGYAVVPYLQPYQMNTVDIDPANTSLAVELTETSRKLAPRAGAVSLIRFASTTGVPMLIHATTEDGESVPFGATVVDDQGESAGLVGQGGRVFTRGAKPGDLLTVSWGTADNESCRLQVPTTDARADDARAITTLEAGCVRAVSPDLAVSEK